MDLQDIYRSHPKLLIAALAAFVAVIVVVVIVTIGGGGSSGPQPGGRVTTHSPSSRSPAASTVTVPNPSYHPSYSADFKPTALDQHFQAEVDASGQETAALEAANPPGPAWTAAFPRVPARATTYDQTYLVAFLRELLGRDYRTQPRTDLERWVSAEAAAALLPGEPRAAAMRSLYAELFSPGTLAEKGDPVPSAETWRQDAREGVTQRVYGIRVVPDAQWSRDVSQGLTSVDPLLRLDDATGTLATTIRGRATSAHFSAQILVASALHHRGYGVAAVDNWKVS